MALDGYFGAPVLALLPALGNISGRMLADTIRVSQRTLSLGLHAAAGIVTAVTGTSPELTLMEVFRRYPVVGLERSNRYPNHNALSHKNGS